MSEKQQIKSGRAVFTIPEIDGRTKAARLIRDITAEIVTDLGGVDQLSGVQKELVKRFATMCAVASEMEARAAMGEELDVPRFTTLSNALRRIAADLGLKRVPRDITTLAEHVAKNYNDVIEVEAE
jgi:hypothetical protein